MKRLARKNRTSKDLGVKTKGHLNDIFDNAIKQTFRINDDEYDFIAEFASDEDLEWLLKESYPTFGEKRKLIDILDNYLAQFENKKKQWED